MAKGWLSLYVDAYSDVPYCLLNRPSVSEPKLAARLEQATLLGLRDAGLEIIERPEPEWTHRAAASMAEGEAAVEFGSYTLGEVKGLRDALAKLPFPASPGTVAGMMPHPVRSVFVIDSHYLPDRAKQGRVGGRIVEYWLNNGWVLQVATADYVKGEERFSREEWAAILTKAERESFYREIY